MRQTNVPVSKLRIVSLGGVDEIGKNMTVFEYEDDIVVVDCGSIFPKEDMLGSTWSSLTYPIWSLRKRMCGLIC